MSKFRFGAPEFSGKIVTRMEEVHNEQNHVKLEFPGIKAGNQFFKLNGKDKIHTPTYCKYVSRYDQLDEFEQSFVFSEYLKLKDKVAQVINLIQTF